MGFMMCLNKLYTPICLDVTLTRETSHQEPQTHTDRFLSHSLHHT